MTELDIRLQVLIIGTALAIEKIQLEIIAFRISSKKVTAAERKQTIKLKGINSVYISINALLYIRKEIK